MKVETWPLERLLPYDRNPRKNDHAVEQVARAIERFGFRVPIVARSSGEVIDGHLRLKAARHLGLAEVPVVLADDMTEEQVRAFRLSVNRMAELAEWDSELLTVEIADLAELGVDIEAIGFDMPALAEIGVDGAQASDIKSSPSERSTASHYEFVQPLSEAFGAPPFSVLDARQGYWQQRKSEWHRLGIKSELGREAGLIPLPSKIDRSSRRREADSRTNIQGFPPTPEWAYPHGSLVSVGAGTSMFDPVLTELLVRWYSAEGHEVLDPFAGGSVRGIVTAKLRRSYTGIDLRSEQVSANREQGVEILRDGDGDAVWIEGNSLDAPSLLPEGYEADMILSCPPYYDLEVYSDDPRDLSTAGTYADFLRDYREIIRAAVSRLRDNRFACWVVGDVRAPSGEYRNFVADTIQAFLDAGMVLWNEAVLVTPVGSLPLRARRPFLGTRKLAKTHQNVLVFYKGDPRKIREVLGEVTGMAQIGEGGDDDAEGDLAGGVVTPSAALEDRYLTEQTPIEQVGEVFLKRDDLYRVAGVPGGKARTCWYLCRQATAGLVTAGSRQSPQVNIVASIARRLGLPCRVHVPSGAQTPELLAAREAGAEVISHRPGHNTVIVARAREDAAALGWTEIPFGMECEEAITQTRAQVPASFPEGVARIVIPIGSGMSFSGLLHGLLDRGVAIPVLGVQVGADPIPRIDRYAPEGWRTMAQIVPSGMDYHTHATEVRLGHVELDPVYEAKCLPFLRPGDMLWVVGVRATSALE